MFYLIFFNVLPVLFTSMKIQKSQLNRLKCKIKINISSILYKTERMELRQSVGVQWSTIYKLIVVIFGVDALASFKIAFSPMVNISGGGSRYENLYIQFHFNYKKTNKTFSHSETKLRVTKLWHLAYNQTMTFFCMSQIFFWFSAKRHIYGNWYRRRFNSINDCS